MERQAISGQNGATQDEDPLPRFPTGPVGHTVEGNDFHAAVAQFKRSLIESTLRQAGWNRTRAAELLGLQRTYLLRLMRALSVKVPLPHRNGRSLFEPTEARERPEIKRD